MELSAGEQPVLRARQVAVVAALSLLYLVLLVGFAPAAHAQTDDGLRVESSTTFEPDTDLEQIYVRGTYTMTNLQADEVFGDRVRSYFYTKWVLALPANVVDFSATSGGVALNTTIETPEDSESIVFGSINLPYNLSFQQTVQLDVSYTIPGGDPRAEGVVARVNESYLSFAIWASGDPGLTNITILIPDGFSTDIEGDLDGLLQLTRDGQTVLEATAIENPQDFFGQIFGRNDDGLLTRLADLPTGTATVRAWPDDPTWADFVVDAIEDDVPIIEDLIGLPWPAGDIEVIETVTPYLFGYGGWFNASSGVIEVGEDLERDLILHELSHAWFNDELIGGRWITEGMAEEFASRTIEATGGERPDPTEPDLADPLRVPLAEWASPWTLDEEDAFGYEQYHYNASWWVTRQITEQIGLDAFSDVLVALAQDELPYPGEGPIEQTVQSTRWTHLFDLLEMQGGATGLDDLFATYVLTASDIEKLEPRREARANYETFAEAGGAWAPPLVIRRQLTSWRFDDVNRLIDAAYEILEIRDLSDDLADDLDVSIEHRAEAEFEMATSVRDLDDVRSQEEALLSDLHALEDDRDDIVAAAAELDTRVEFPPMDYDDAIAELEVHHATIAELAQLRDNVAEAAAELALASPPWPAPDGPTDFGASAALAEARLATLVAIAEATTTVEAPRSFTQRVGLWGKDPNGALAAARAAFETDDLDDSLAQTGRAEVLLAQATARGQNRLTWAVTIVGTILLMVLILTWARRRTTQVTPRPQTTESRDQPVR